MLREKQKTFQRLVVVAAFCVTQHHSSHSCYRDVSKRVKAGKRKPNRIGCTFLSMSLPVSLSHLMSSGAVGVPMSILEACLAGDCMASLILRARISFVSISGVRIVLSVAERLKCACAEPDAAL